MINLLDRYPHYKQGSNIIYINQSCYISTQSRAGVRTATKVRISIQASSMHECTPQEDHESNEAYTHFEVALLDRDSNPITIHSGYFPTPYPNASLWDHYYCPKQEAYINVPRKLIEPLLAHYLPRTTNDIPRPN